MRRAPGRRYHLKRVLGEGAFGRVYLAEQESEGGFRRLVALKVLHGQAATKREAERRMRDEARVLGQLQHRNIVAVLDLVRLSDRWAIVMDHVSGVDLEALVEAGPLPPMAAFAIGVGVARALAAAHAATDPEGRHLEVVHRDIKPSNVRVTAEAEVKVLDFGVARFSLDGREALTKGAGWIGTERYMAPERILNQGDTPAGDVYALGATVYELLRGEPFGRTPALPNHHATMLAEALEALPVPDDAPPAWWDAVAALEQTLACDPADRPSAAEIADSWASCVASLPGESLGSFAARVIPALQSAPHRAGEAASGVLEEGSRDETTLDLGPEGSLGGSGPPGRGRWALAAAVVAMLVGGVGFAAFVVAGLLAFDVIHLPGPPPEPELPDVAVEPPPAPSPSPAPAPVEIAPEPAPAPPVPEVAAPVPPRPPPRGPRVDRAMFSLENASGIRVSCGTVSAKGTRSVRIEGFLAGPCEVRANYLGDDYRDVVEVTGPRTVQCRVQGEVMTCS